MDERGTRDSWAGLSMAVYGAMVTDRMHFAQAAYRDGEWFAITGSRSGQNVNKEEFTPELGAALRRTLLEPVGQWCTFWWPHERIGRQAYEAAQAWLAKHQPDVTWIPDRPISRANEIGQAAPFFRACRTRRVVIVGPAHMADLDLFDVAVHVPVPPSTAWQEVDRVRDAVLDAHEPDDLVLFAAGMGANLMIWDLWPTLRGRATLIDVGAALDPYCGHMSRAVFRSPGWQEDIMTRNRP